MGARPECVEARLSRLIESEQENWFLWVPVLVGAGILAYFGLPGEPQLWPALLALAGVVGLGRWWRGGLCSLLVPAILMAVTVGFVAAKVRSDVVAEPAIEARLANAMLRGAVERVEPRAEGGQRITIRVEGIEGLAGGRTPGRVRLRLRSEGKALTPGVRIEARVSLSPPPTPAFPGGYDFARAAYFMGLGGVGSVHGEVRVLPAVDEASIWFQFRDGLAQMRQHMDARITAALPGQAGAIASALITGERGSISEETNVAFRDSGLTHILSISGLHMTVMAGFVFLLVRIGLAAVPPIALRWSVKKWAAVLAALAAFGYLLISGGSIATVRSWLMISIMFMAVLADRPALALRNVALAALVVLVAMPESVFDAGFQMSFAAVAALVAAYEALRERRQARERDQPRGLVMSGALFFGSIVLATLVASVAVWPIAAFHFHKSQQFAVIANLLAVPVCNVVVMPMALLVLVLFPFGLEAWPLAAMGAGISWMIWCAEWVAVLPGAVVSVPQMPVGAFACMMSGGLWLLLWRRRWRLLGLVAIGLGLALAPTASMPDVLIGRDGAVVAVRGVDGRLSAVGRGSYELERWLERDGDGRKAADALAGEAFRCDEAGCRARVKGRKIAVVRHPSAMRDDCSSADIVVVAVPDVRRCGAVAGQAGKLVIDRAKVARDGVHALYIGKEDIRVESVASYRGQRPWSGGAGHQ